MHQRNNYYRVTVNEKNILERLEGSRARGLEGFTDFNIAELLAELDRIRQEPTEVSTVSDVLTEILRPQDIPVGALDDKTIL